MKASRYLGSRYMSADDLDGNPITGTITGVGVQTIVNPQGEKRDRIVIDLDGFIKPIVLNATNLQAIISSLGDETDSWLGATVRVGKHRTKFAGKPVDGLLVTVISQPSGEV